MAREFHENSKLGFIEVFTDAPLSVVESRDPKGLYKKARAGEIKGEPCSKMASKVFISCHLDFTGISAPYEAPESPEIHINTDECDVTESVQMIMEYLTNKGYI
jgi:adenylylsulfate kinase